MNISKKIAFCAVMSSLAIVFGYLETLFPVPIPIPGIKLGLGNIVVLITICTVDKQSAFAVMLVKVTASALLFSAPSVFIYSLCGGLLSFCAMCFMHRFQFDIISISLCGGVFHNIGQLCAAAVLMKNSSVFGYMPFLVLSGIATALLTGICSKLILKRLNFLNNP